MFFLKKVFFLFFLLNQTYCRSNVNDHEENNLKLMTCDSKTSSLFASELLEAENQAKEILSGISGSCNDAENFDHDLCKDVQIHFSTKKAKATSQGQRILIMDNGFHINAMTVYNNRVLDFVGIASDGSLKTVDEVLTVNKASYEIAKLIDQKYPELPRTLLSSIGNELSKKVNSDQWFRRSGGGDWGHGTAIFTQLAEYNPFAEFVLIDDQNFKDVETALGIDLCKIDQDHKELDKYRSYLENFSKEIISLIKKHDIDFVNFSFSPDINDLSRQLKKRCNKVFDIADVSKLLQIDLDYFFKPLYSIPNVIAVQAILQTGDFHSERSRKDHRIDCATFGNRVRVVGFGTLDSKIPSEGSSDKNLVSKILGALPCADLAINLGEHGGLHSKRTYPKCFVNFHYTPFFEPEPPVPLAISSSYAAPVAISYLIYLKNTLPKNTPIEEILRIAKDPKSFIKDPIRHRQIEVYRMGYLDSEISF